MTSRLIAATVVLAAALTLGLSLSPSGPAGALLSASVQSSVVDAASNLAWSGSEITGAAAYDTATVVVSGVTPTGDLTYTLYNGDGCTGTPISTADVALNADGTVPDSLTTAALAAGSYSFEAVYDGDSNYSASPPSCQAFTVNAAPSTVDTAVFDAATDTAWSGSETTGASAEDTSTIGGSITGFTPSGSVTYDYFGSGTCTGSVVATTTVALNANGTVPSSQPTGALGAGTYAFDASYTGDGNYAPAGPSACEPFTVGQATATFSTTVFDAATNAAWSGSETTGASAYDTSTISGTVAGFTPSGTVTYDYFDTGSCTGSAVAMSTVTVSANGTVPPSQATGPLGAGSDAFDASYSGDANYGPTGPSSCEPFSLGLSAPSVTTTVLDGSTHAAWAGTEVTGATAYDSASVSGSGVTPTGSVTYQFFSGATCTGTPVTTDQETLSGGVAPDSSLTAALARGSYAFDAQYGGDGNYTSTTSSCETFSVGQATPSTATVVDDASTGTPWSGSEVTGATAYDTATVTGVAGFSPTGTVTYTFFADGTCTGPGVTQDVTLSGGNVPDSATTAILAVGSYSFEAQYGGDANYLVGAVSGCEPFTVAKATPSAPTTVVDDANANAPWAGTETTGATAYDTAMLVGTGVTPTGTVTYDFFSNGTCTGPPSTSDGVALSGGVVPNSSTTSPLDAGTYSFDAQYGGDGNYDASAASVCEPFSVAKETPSVASVVDDAATGTTWSGTEVTGAFAYDTSTVTGVTGVPPTGTVTYQFFSTASCTGSPASTDVQTIAGGLVPSSAPTGALGADTYAFDATYDGDANYTASAASVCEPFTVAKATPTISTVVFDATSNAPWGDDEVDGATAYDTSIVAGLSGFTPTGTVTYSFFQSGTCTGTPTTDQVTLAGGTVPPSATTSPLAVGSYSYDAVYNGDTNYLPTVASTCEPFGVGKRAPTVPTVSNLPAGAQIGGSFAAVVSTTGDGVTSVVTTTAGICSVAANGLTVSFVGVGTCTLTAEVGATGDYFGATGNPQSFPVGRANTSAPSITNLPTDPIAEGGFVATVSTNGDGQRSVSSSTPGVCTVGVGGFTVTYVGPGVCTLTAQVGQGPTHLGASGSPQTFTILPIPHGYWLVGSDGGIFSFGLSQFYGSTGNMQLQRPVVGITPTDTRRGYWLVASDGGIFAFGDAGFYGSIPGIGLHPAGSGAAPSLNAPIVAMVPSATGHGYFMVASDGGVFAFGDARFAGSCPGIGGCSGSAVAVVPDATGNGYWLFTNTGNVYTFGDAPAYGEDPGTGVPVTSAAATPDGHGYWMLFSNGVVANFGDASALGAPVGYTNPANPATTIFPTANGGGYWVGSARGDVFAYGDAPFLGSMAGTVLNGMIIAASGY